MSSVLLSLSLSMFAVAQALTPLIHDCIECLYNYYYFCFLLAKYYLKIVFCQYLPRYNVQITEILIESSLCILLKLIALTDYAIMLQVFNECLVKAM